MVEIACHVGPRAQEDWPLEKTEEAPRRQQEAKLRGPIRRGTMSFGKGEFLSVETVHKIKIAVGCGRASVGSWLSRERGFFAMLTVYSRSQSIPGGCWAALTALKE